MSIVLFEDDRVAGLSPASLSRPAFAISCGGNRLVDLVRQVDPEFRCLVREHLRAIADADFAVAPDDRSPSTGQLVLVNARLVPAASLAKQLTELLASGRPGVAAVGNDVAVAVVEGAPAASAGGEPDQLAKWLTEQRLPPLDVEVALFEFPHDIVKQHLATLGPNLGQRLAEGDYQESRDGVFVARDATIGDYTVTDTREGPIVLEEGVVIGSHCYLQGPIHLDRGATIVDHASLKGHVAAGRRTKLGGEITASVIEPYSNKSHHGFLGHSYIGSWVNLGAGTTNSNLKNTYGQINVQYGERRIATDMQFLGCMVGDYTKSAINTSIFTGKTIGACSMLYGWITDNVPSFVNDARSFGQISAVSLAVARTIQARAFARRGATPRRCDGELLQSIFDLTAGERARLGASLSAGPPSL